MKRVLKVLGYIVGTLVVLILAAVGGVYAVTSSHMGKSYDKTVETIPIPTDPASIARGQHLTESVGKCAACHGDNLAGKLVMDAPVFARLTSSNLTSGKGGIGATYTDADWVRSLRHGVGPSGKPLIFMPSEAFTHFSDADLGAIIAYMKTVPAADMPVAPQKTIGPIARMIYLAGKFALVPAELIDPNTSRAAVPEGTTAAYGAYLAKTGGCTSCHGASLSGGSMVEQVKVLNLTRGGEVGKWSESDFINAIRTGRRPDGRVLSSVMPWPFMKGLTDDELHAYWAYIQSLPAKQMGEL
jgi:cytochrome c553